jgi:hypothetical protein
VSDQDLAAVLNADAALYGDDVALGTPPPPAPVPEAQPEKPSGPRRPSGLQAAAAAGQSAREQRPDDGSVIDGTATRVDDSEAPPPDDREEMVVDEHGQPVHF